eukprot:1641953-Pyramimonas_sp.AAC.1
MLRLGKNSARMCFIEAMVMNIAMARFSMITSQNNSQCTAKEENRGGRRWGSRVCQRYRRSRTSA